MPAAATRILSLVTTVGSEEDAQRLASALLEQRLAACVQIDSVQSRYRWQGALCVEPEWRLTVKSAPGKLAALQALVVAQHPYELPQLVWQLLDATPDYAAWVRAEVQDLSAP